MSQGYSLVHSVLFTLLHLNFPQLSSKVTLKHSHSFRVQILENHWFIFLYLQLFSCEYLIFHLWSIFDSYHLLNSCPDFAVSSPSCCIVDCLLSSLSCQTVASRTTTVWMGIAPPRLRLPSRSLKFPRSPQNPRLHAGPVPPAAN